MQQLSHQTLNSTCVLTAFGVFTVPPHSVCLARLFLETQHRSAGVVRSVFALVERAGQNELFGGLRLAFLSSITMIETKQDRQLTLLAMHSEIPAIIGSRPSRNIHKRLFHSYQS
jgi:hypothetical protein